MRNSDVAAIIKQLEDREGRLSAEGLLKAAEDPKHQLHPRFEWNDSVAGRRYRLEQARELLRGVRVDVHVEHVRTPVIAYVRDPDRPLVQGYRAVKSLKLDKGAAREAIESEFEMAAAHLRRARDIAKALGFAAEVEQRLWDVIDLQKVIRTGKAAKAGKAGRAAAGHA